MFWDNVAWVYDLFVNVINRKTHEVLKRIVSDRIGSEDVVLECACGTGLLSAVIAERCRSLVATDFSCKMIRRAKRKCLGFNNVSFRYADINSLDYPDDSFDKVVAGNVIHLLDDPVKALRELARVCRPCGKLIIPTYMNRDRKGLTSTFTSAIGKAGADFKRQFTVESYRRFFLDAGFDDVEITLAEGRIPCAVAMMTKEADNEEA